jgi:hypothetical protein
MAYAEIQVCKAGLNEFASWDTFDFLPSGGDGWSVDYSGLRDDRVLLLLRNTDTADIDVYVQMGDSIEGVASSHTVSVLAGKMAAAVVDSMAFKNVEGEYKGKVIVVPSDVGLAMAAVYLPS